MDSLKRSHPIPKGTPIYEELSKFINYSWGSVGKDGTFSPYFPGPQPISIERKHLGGLGRARYMACEKTDGIRMAIVCKLIGDRKYTVVVNRAMEMHSVKFYMSRTAYNGTILDGEFVGDKFMIYDAVMVGGMSVKHMNLDTRLGHVVPFIKSIMAMPTDPFTIRLKTFYPIMEMQELIRKVKENDFPYENDGLIFTPVDEPVRMGTHETMFKWKPGDKNTIDYLVKPRKGGELGLYIQERGEHIFSTMITPTPEWAKKLQSGVIVECRYLADAWPRRWEPVNIRVDKNHPNNRRTLHRTMVNIEEDIKIEEFSKLRN
tara:strand:+ start:417 stop:1370 length:954 start_codon:yes stop_codon:yes gene_type:complete